jgi:hypothetical protein
MRQGNQSGKITRSEKTDVVFMLFGLLAILATVYYIWWPSRGFFHSDCTDTILWAQASLDGGRVLNPDFNYAALLPFGANIWYTPLLAIWGMTMNVQLAGLLIFLIVFTLALNFFFKSIGWTDRWRGLGIAITLMTLSSSEKLREIMWGHVIYYSLGLLFLLIGLGIVIRLETGRTDGLAQRSSRRRNAVLYITLFLLSMGAATDGYQMAAVYLLPIAGALILARFLDPARPFSIRAHTSGINIISILLAATAIGLFLLELMRRGGISAGYANAFSVYAPTDDWAENAGRILPYFLSLLGARVVDNIPLASIESILIFIKITSGLIILTTPLLGLLRYNRIKTEAARITLLAHLINSAILIYLFVFGIMSSSDWRLTPMLGTGTLATLCILHDRLCDRSNDRLNDQFKDKENSGQHKSIAEKQNQANSCSIRKRLANFALAGLILLSLTNLVTMLSFSPREGSNSSLHLTKNYLIEAGLNYGYATFWNSNALTLLSDSKARVVTIDADQNGVNPRYYQTNNNWFRDQPGQSKYFLLLTPHEKELLEQTPDWEKLMALQPEGKLLYENYLFVFDRNIWSELGKELR